MNPRVLKILKDEFVVKEGPQIETTWCTFLGREWRRSGEHAVLLRVKEKKSTKDIAVELERSVGAVKAHKLKLAIDACTNKGMDVESAIETYGVSKTQLESALEKKNGDKKALDMVTLQ
jgi:DNA-binding NarL/FixJ family response regulator